MLEGLAPTEGRCAFLKKFNGKEVLAFGLYFTS
jgi:hypothetical protein